MTVQCLLCCREMMSRRLGDVNACSAYDLINIQWVYQHSTLLTLLVEEHWYSFCLAGGITAGLHISSCVPGSS